jgi:hypothetical protein
MIGSAAFNIAAPKAGSLKAVALGDGTYRLTLTGASAVGGLTKVEIPVWSSANGQRDIHWYTATKDASGNYVAIINPAKHSYHWGDYIAHAYVTGSNGVRSMARSAIFNVDSKSFQYDTSELYRIMGTSSVSVNQMVAWYNSKRKIYPSALGNGGAGDIQTFCAIVIQESQAEGVRPEVVFAQSMKETGWLQFGGAVKVHQYNFAGLGATDSNPSGSSAQFPDVRTGVRAQVQHLKAYACNDALKNGLVDPRFNLVARGCAPYVQWLGQKENPSGKGWATAANYGYSLMEMILQLKSY